MTETGGSAVVDGFEEAWNEAFNWAERLGVRLTPLAFEGCGDATVPALEPNRPGPRRGDLLVVAGTVTEKMALLLSRLWDELPEPKWTIVLGSGGPCPTYAVAGEIGRVIPVDVHRPDWPPRPEDLREALAELEKRIAPGAPG